MFRAFTKAKNSFLKGVLEESGKAPCSKNPFLKGVLEESGKALSFFQAAEAAKVKVLI